MRDTIITMPFELSISETQHTYPVKKNIWDNWYPFALRAFEKLRDKLKCVKVTSFASIGTSNGIDAIAAYLVFEGLKKIVLTDIDRRVLPIAIENVRKYAKKSGIIALHGSLCEPLIERGIKVDVIHANLPLLPNGGDLNKGYRRASRYDKNLFRDYHNDDWIKRHLLEPYFVLLKQGKSALNPGGSVICSIGGRIPYKILVKMIEKAGYTEESLVTGFKLQTEAFEVFSGFNNAERDGVAFDFYKYNQAVSALERLGLNEPFIGLTIENLSAIISPFRITAKHAYEIYKKDKHAKIGHVVHVIRAVRA